MAKENMKKRMLKQKYRIRWAIDGDENTKFIHAIIRNNYNKCNIRGLTINGCWNENPLDIKEEAVRHFSSLFEEKNGFRPSLSDLSYPSISHHDAESLEVKFTKTEILEAEKGEISKGCNASFVTLIPKKVNPEGLGDFCPINLIESYYKIVSKILSNRLRKVIPAIVGPEQCAFLKGRYILDGFVIANETIDFLKVNRKKGIIFKVNFEKSFDSINWCFRLEVMKSVGFGDKCRKWILSWLTSASISILINGSPSHEFSIGRGVRQGDQLSPFLFILAAEGLNILTKVATDKGMFKGVEVGFDKVLVFHLQYADDTIFFEEWSRRNVNSLGNLLKCFELASGLKVNFQKSSVFGIGVKEVEINLVACYIGCQVALLGKWWWRFKTEPTSLWAKVIRSIYGRCDGLMLDDEFTHQTTLGTWQNIVLTVTLIEDLQIQFKSSFVKNIGDGGSTSFWNEQWCNEGKMCTLFSRLFRLQSNKEATFKDRVSCNDSGLRFNWSWIRVPSGRSSGELTQIQDKVVAVNVDPSKDDSWSWSDSAKGVFEVKIPASMINDKLLGNIASFQVLTRNNLVPKKVEIFIWRALKKGCRLGLKSIKGVSIFIVFDAPFAMTISKRWTICSSFCKHALDIWERLFKWWGLGNFWSYSVQEIIMEDPNISSNDRGGKVWQATKWVCTYRLWKNRNNMIFQRKSWSGPVALNEIKIMSFQWITNKSKYMKLDWLTWLSNPSHYLN
ncbi:uncharacterized protein [Rutidosis leptorrhynchoides]|uniref:uncharacterized protein n=1 Tax=Rutidosis leptorrhynchoides TaxID=125765 RepID=UPI003A996733